MSRLLDDLDPDFKSFAMELIARCIESGILVMIIFTGRTEQEQADLFAQGRTKPGKIVTWTLDSKHIMKPPSFKSNAIDICPYSLFILHGTNKLQWDSSDPIWQKIGAIGTNIGLKWGVWIKGINKDPGHFEMPSSSTRIIVPSALRRIGSMPLKIGT